MEERATRVSSKWEEGRTERRWRKAPEIEIILPSIAFNWSSECPPYARNGGHCQGEQDLVVHSFFITQTLNAIYAWHCTQNNGEGE